MSVEHNLKQGQTKTAIADAPDDNHYSFKQWTGDTNHISSGQFTDPTVVVTMPNHNVTLNATYNPYRILTVNQGIIVPGLFTPINYGRLYNWYAANDSRNICSTGWHLPAYTEFTTLVTDLGGTSVAGGKLKETGTSHWSTPNTDATNEAGFNTRASGIRTNTGTFGGILSSTRFHTSYDGDTISLQYEIIYNSASFYLVNSSKKYGYPVRPVKDSTTLTNGQTGTYVDPSGIIYPTICIGMQEWVACNIITKHYRNGDAIPEVTDNTAWAALTTAAMCSYNNDDSNI